jgi:TRAP-type C4-dicarboxylate transport system permease small subunit
MALSTAVLRAERATLTVLMGLLVLLILLNVVTRYSGTPIYWVDEAAVFTMVWLTFVGASVMTRLRMDFAVGLVSDHLPPGGAKVLKVIATVDAGDAPLTAEAHLYATVQRFVDAPIR